MNAALIESFRWALLSAAITVSLFVLQWTVYSPWWKDPMGRTVVWKDIAVLLGLLPWIMVEFFQLHGYAVTVVAWVWVISIVMISVIMVWRMVVWFREMRRDPVWREPVTAVVRHVLRMVRRIIHM